MVACFCSLWGFNPTSYYFILVLVLRDLLIGWRRCFGSPEGFTASRSRWGQCFGGQILWVDRVMTLKSCKWDDSCSWGYIYIIICYATVRSLARADLRHAPLLYVLWHLYTHTSCYSTVRSLAHRRAIFYLPTQTRIGVGLGGATTFTCAHTGHATLKMC